MRPEVLRLVDLSSDDRERWRELARHSVEPNPFFESGYVEPLARGLACEADVHLAVVRDAETWAACVPVRRTDRWHRIPLPAVVSWRGHVLFGLLGTPLIRTGSPQEALATLLTAVRAVRSHPSYVAFDWIAGDGPIAKDLRESAELRGSIRAPIEFERSERPVVHRRPADTYLKDAINSKHRAELRRQRRRLGEALDDELVMVDRSGDEGSYQDFITLEANSPKSATGTMLADDPGYTRFFMDMCSSFAADGRLQLLALEGGGQTLAMTCNVTAGDAVFGLKTAFASQWASFSPGTLLQAEQFSFFHDHTSAQLFDSCADANNVVANRLFADRRAIVSLAAPTGGAAGLIARPVLHGARLYRNRKS